MANRFNEIFPSFVPLYSEFSPRLRIIDNFSDCISFNIRDKGKDDNHHTHQLDKLALEFSSSPSTTIIATDASIKNDIATFILHIYTYNRPIIKMIHHVVYVTSTKAELFVIRSSINQALNLDNVSKVIVITDSIYVARKIFEPSVHSSKFNQQPFSLIFVNSSHITRTIPSNFGNAQAISDGIFTMRSIIQFHFFHAKYSRTSARKAKVTLSSKFGK